jgi:hypothetical protein
MKKLLVVLLFSCPIVSYAQFVDDFSDGDFLNNPTWIGDDSVFVVVDEGGNNMLRSNKQIASTKFYLSTASTQLNEGQWEFFTRLAFNTSGTNYVDYFLTSTESNLLSSTANGYFVRVGNTQDEISLYKKVGTVATKLIDGVDGVTNSSNNQLKIKVIRTSNNEWTLERQKIGTDLNYVQEGSVIDNEITSSNFFGIAITQSTASFFQKHFFDDFYVGPIIFDTQAPILVSANANGTNELNVLFDEVVTAVSSENSANYSISPNLTILSAERDAINLSMVKLTLVDNIQNGVNYTLTTNNIADNSGNVSGTQSTNFMVVVAETPEVGDIVINEFMCNPLPSVGLPEREFVEIYNRSNKFFNIQGWKLGDNASDGTIQAGWIYPGEYKVLCGTSSVPFFPGSIGVTSIPIFNVTGDDVVIKDANGNILDKLTYTNNWYKDDLKKNGGYTLELINPFHPCSDESNWRASNHELGGTPGEINSVFDDTPDTSLPEIKELTTTSPNLLKVEFNKGMDSMSMLNAESTFSPNLTVFEQIVVSKNALQITFNENLVGSQTYQITLPSISDCWLNTTALTGEFALPEKANFGDVVVNEILFNVFTGGSDFVELRNNSNKIINLNGWKIANFKDTITNVKIINQNYILEPNEYVVLTANPQFQLNNYPYSAPIEKFITITLPGLNNDSSTVFLIQDDDLLIDKVSYTDKWHFQLISDKKGKSLERADPFGASNDPKNWHTAAESVGYATPGIENSQYYPGLTTGDISLTSEIISPDGDGIDDLLQINYTMQSSEMVASITIYDERGRIIKDLVKNEYLGLSGSVIWDGITNSNQKASIGSYVLIFEAYHISSGDVFSKKKAFVVAGQL